MCELEVGCEYKPVSPIEKRNYLSREKPCDLNPDMCSHMRFIRFDRRQHAVFREGQMDLSLHFVKPTK